jgi:hypothetical protein
MKRHLVALALAVGALMLPGTALAKIGDEPPPDPEPSGGQTTQIGNALQWELRSPAAQISAGVPFSLRTTTSNQYLAFGQQRFGINLGYFNTPHFEWELRGTAPEIRTSSPTLGLFNASRGDHVVRASRPFGVNLRWLGDTQ